MSSGHNGTLYTHELTAAGVACTRPNQSAFQHRNGETHEPPSLAEELLTIDGFWGERVSFLRSCGSW